MNNALLKLNKKHKISILLSLIPIYLGNYLNENFGVRSLVYLVIILSPFYFIKTKEFLNNIRQYPKMNYFVFVILYLILCIVSLLYTLDRQQGINIIIILFLPFILAPFFSRFDLLEMYKYFAWSGLLFTIILYLDIPSIFFEYYTESERFAYYHGDIQINPNYYSVFLNYIAIYFLYKFTSSKAIQSLVFSGLPLILTIFFLIETQSRSGFFTFIIIVVLTFLFKKNKSSVILGSFSLAFILMLILLNINIDFQTRLADSDLNQREDNWGIVIDQSLETKYSFLFGYGVGSAELKIGEIGSVYSIVDELGRHRANAHSMYFENLLNVGLIGLLLLLLTYFMLVKNIYKGFKYETSYIPLMVPLVVLISGLVGNQMRAYPFVIFFSITLAFTIQNSSKYIPAFNAKQESDC